MFAGTTAASTFTDILVDNLDGTTDGLGANTDGFDVSASDVRESIYSIISHRTLER